MSKGRAVAGVAGTIAIAALVFGPMYIRYKQGNGLKGRPPAVETFKGDTDNASLVGRGIDRMVQLWKLSIDVASKCKEEKDGLREENNALRKELDRLKSISRPEMRCRPCENVDPRNAAQ